MESMVFPKPPSRTSMFANHTQPVKQSLTKHQNWQQPDWMAGILLLCFILLAWNHVYNPGRFLQVMRAPFSKRFINQLVREGNLFNERIAFTLVIMYVMVLSQFIYLFNIHFQIFQLPEIPGWLLYLGIMAGIALYLTVKVTLIYLLGVIFRTRETTYNYLLNTLIFAILMAPLILFFNVSMLYVNHPVFYNISLFMVLLIFIIRFIRGFFIGMALTKFSYLLLFVYLCSLEILPLLVVIKILQNIAKTAVV
jgi:hypothetical protein